MEPKCSSSGTLEFCFVRWGSRWMDDLMQGIHSVFLFGKELIPIGQEKSPALNMHFAFACVWATTTEVCPPFLNLFDPKSVFFFVVSRGQVRRLLQFGDLLNRCKTKVESAELALPTVPCIDLSVPALCRAVQPCNGCHLLLSGAPLHGAWDRIRGWIWKRPKLNQLHDAIDLENTQTDGWSTE